MPRKKKLNRIKVLRAFQALLGVEILTLVGKRAEIDRKSTKDLLTKAIDILESDGVQVKNGLTLSPPSLTYFPMIIEHARHELMEMLNEGAHSDHSTQLLEMLRELRASPSLRPSRSVRIC